MTKCFRLIELKHMPDDLHIHRNSFHKQMAFSLLKTRYSCLHTAGFTSRVFSGHLVKVSASHTSTPALANKVCTHLPQRRRTERGRWPGDLCCPAPVQRRRLRRQHTPVCRPQGAGTQSSVELLQFLSYKKAETDLDDILCSHNFNSYACS